MQLNGPLFWAPQLPLYHSLLDQVKGLWSQRTLACRCSFLPATSSSLGMGSPTRPQIGENERAQMFPPRPLDPALLPGRLPALGSLPPEEGENAMAWKQLAV